MLQLWGQQMKFDRLRRREFITLLGGAVTARTLAARAQGPGRTYRLGVLIQGGRQTPHTHAFFDELRLSGFIEGHNLALVPGSFDVPVDQLAVRAMAVVKAAPDVLLGVGEVATRALRAATQSIPIVGSADDMVAAGLVTSLSMPGANITGMSMLSPELDGKRQDILIEAAPSARRMAALVDARQTRQSHTKALQDAARVRGVELSVVGVERPEQIAPAIDAAKASGARPSTSWRRRYGTAVAAPSSSEWLQRACRRSTNGSRWRTRGASRLTALASSRSTASMRGWLPRYCAAPSPPTSRSSSRPISSW